MSYPPVHDLQTFMAQLTDEMASEYQRIYARSHEDPGTAGDQGEKNWAMILENWLPSDYHVRTKGRILNHDGQMSGQIDVLVLKPHYPKKLLEKQIWLADGVAAAFECKNTLKSNHISEAVRKCSEIKRLFAPRLGTPYRELTSPLVYGILAHSHGWKNPSSRPIEIVNTNATQALSEVESPRLLMDCICVADLATWASIRILGEGLTPATSLVCAAQSAEDQEGGFRPIGALIGFLTEMIAKEDIRVRSIADYYRNVNLWGSASGEARYWPWSILSESVQRGLYEGRSVNGGEWSEWSRVL